MPISLEIIDIQLEETFELKNFLEKYFEKLDHIMMEGRGYSNI